MEPISRAVADVVPEQGSVVVFRALPGLGDLLCAVPAIRALRRARRDVRISYVGLPEIKALVDRFAAYVDRFVAFPGFPGLPDRRPDIRGLPEFLRAMQAERFDLAIQLHGSGELTNPITALLGARRMAGHVRTVAPPTDAACFLPWVEGCSEVRRGLRLMAHLGWPSDEESLEFPFDPGAHDALRQLAGVDAVLDRPHVVVHPGAREASRRWSPAGFAEVADRLDEAGYAVVLTGTAAERNLTALVAGLMRRPALDLAGLTSVDLLAALVSGSALLVCNDTGVSHLAAALGTPSVVVFRASDRDRWAPLDRRLHRPVFGSTRQVLSEARRVLRGVQRDAA